MSDIPERNTTILTEAHNALNIGFGAILSAYVGISLAEIDDHAFDASVLAWFFVALAVFILFLSVGNAVFLRGERRLGAIFLAASIGAALIAQEAGRMLGFEIIILRVLAICWVSALFASDAALTAINYLHYRKHR